ncbi:MAG: hypothetical protein HGB04_03995 [Chlorobiaceae bacterium]|nr:hypothetical protein [Chlorobiaceae bacterium]
MQRSFGSGSLYAIPKYDAYGNAITTPTPVKFGTVQNFSLDISGDLKELYGQSQFAEEIASGKKKVTGKMQFAAINGRLYNSLLFGQTLAAGVDIAYNDVIGSVIPATPYQITPTVPNSGVWATDLGVINLATGSPLTRVAAAGTPTTGQYTVAAGVYTFASADAGQTVLINFEYTATSTGSAIIDVYNLPMGYNPTFSLYFGSTFSGQNTAFIIDKCVSTKFSFSTKLDDFTIPEIDFTACVNPLTNRVMRIATTAV